MSTSCRLSKGGAAGGPEAAANGAAAGQPKGMNLAAKLMEQMGWRGGGLGKTQQARSLNLMRAAACCDCHAAATLSYSLVSDPNTTQYEPFTLLLC